RAPPFSKDAEIRGHVKIGIQPEPGQEVSIRAFWCRRAELELIKVFHTLTDLTAEAKPNILIGSERDIFQAVPKIVGLANFHPFQGRPVLVEPSGGSDLKRGPLYFTGSLFALSPPGKRAVGEQRLKSHSND